MVKMEAVTINICFKQVTLFRSKNEALMYISHKAMSSTEEDNPITRRLPSMRHTLILLKSTNT